MDGAVLRGVPVPPGGRMASAVGPVATDGGDWLVFLKKFRRIVEGDGEPAGKIATIERLVEMAEASAEFRMVRHLLDG